MKTQLIDLTLATAYRQAALIAAEEVKAHLRQHHILAPLTMDRDGLAVGGISWLEATGPDHGAVAIREAGRFLFYLPSTVTQYVKDYL